jgi:rhodanese-related sulfurtransferase
MDIETITRDELKAKLDAGADLRLVMTLGEWAFQAKHIPSSEHFPTIEAAIEFLAKDDEIVVYCSGPTCVASEFAYRGLVEHGYSNVRRYRGGLEDWEAAGYTLEGSAVE